MVRVDINAPSLLDQHVYGLITDTTLFVEITL